MAIANTCTVFTLILIQQYSVIPDIHNEKKGIFLIQKERICTWKKNYINC